MSIEAIIAPSGLRLSSRSPNLHRLSEEDLVRLAQKGSAAATERLVSLYSPLVRSISNKFFLVGAEREDVIQEGLIGLFKAIKKFHHTRDIKFKCFASLCVTRQIQTAVRDSARSKHNSLNFADPVSYCEHLPIGVEKSSDYSDCLGELISEYCVGLTEFEKTVLREVLLGKSYADIGITLGCAAKAVDNGLQRAKRKIMIKRCE